MTVAATILLPRKPGRQATAAAVLRAAIASSVLRVVEHEAVIRADDDPEGVHQARVGCRRLRSDLRTFGSLVDREWAKSLRDELRWFAGELGTMRDRDVLAARLRAQMAELTEDDQLAAESVVAKLDRERVRACAKVVAVLDGARYRDLLERLVNAANAPRTLPRADAAAAGVVPGLAAHPFRKLRNAVERLGERPADDELHALRIRAKRARYVADVAVPVAGRPARALTKRLGALQDVLGDHHDCVVAIDWLRTASASATRPQAFALGQLAARQAAEAERLRTAWRSAWAAVDRPKLTAWMA